jgi:hypothetical protein
MQSMMNNYLESSTSMFVDMQQQLQDRARHLFTGMGMPGYGKEGDEPSDNPLPTDPPAAATEEAVVDVEVVKPAPKRRAAKS